MGVRDFAISTNHPFNRYRPGQTVRGKIHFKLHSSMLIRGIYVRFKGAADVSWLERRKKKSHNKTVTTTTRYYGEHLYFDEKVYFKGQPYGDSFELPSGEHNYKFQYNLPVGLPTSFEGPVGNIYYSVKAVIDIPWGTDEMEEAKLNIWSPINLNLTPNLKDPMYITDSKNLCCFCCISGPISVQIRIPRTGYACLEDIPIQMEVDNLSNAKITMVEFKIEQTITYHSESPRHHIKEIPDTLCFIRCPGVSSRSSHTYDEKLTIPSGADLNFDNCGLLDIRYRLNVRLFIDGCHLDMYLYIPITLGSVPIKPNQPTSPSVSILAGLGTPYPFETEQNPSATETDASYLFNNEYGWMINVGKTLTPDITNE